MNLEHTKAKELLELVKPMVDDAVKTLLREKIQIAQLIIALKLLSESLNDLLSLMTHTPVRPKDSELYYAPDLFNADTGN